MKTEDLDTPVPVIDLAIVDANLKRMQDYCDRHGIALRPHIKTHKIAKLAERQLALGAKGITCQKLGEAEVMADAGIEDILISYPLIGPVKAKRLAALAGRAKMSVAIDSLVALETVASAAQMANADIGVLVEFDSGLGRTGVVTVGEALDLAQKVTDTPHLSFDGLMTYPASEASVPFIKQARDAFAAAGLSIPKVSGGGTANAFRTHEFGVIDELRVGTYLYNDRMMMGVGHAELEDCAFDVVVTVVSRPTPDRAIIDAGTKSLTSDPAGKGGPGHGLIREYPDAVIERLTEEHGMVDLSACETKPEIGERLRIVPNHVCPVSNLHDSVLVLENGSLSEWRVDARGLTR
ncbi:alanine racemase [Martelella radicis]|uniref:D-serine deaminase-like pyridoxal phosphate-dependent protein n=1 Tax=Martelella radicis TaxID=1397476 RepID=A0A7W6KFI9_9HYPH|nr:alanine racemase [Martelella radicis]MBB4120271.1 D-serine deaminase-like pyridoxal phosphate-dependent protein [Martelella radicis]